MKRKDSEMVRDHQIDVPLFSHAKKIKLGMDEEMPLIFEEDEEVPIISEVFEAELLKEQEFVLHEPVEGLPPGNSDLMTAVHEMTTDDEVAAAREESGYRNEVMEEPDEEEAMEVEEGSLQQQQEEWIQPRRATPMAMIWSGGNSKGEGHLLLLAAFLKGGRGKTKRRPGTPRGINMEVALIFDRMSWSLWFERNSKVFRGVDSAVSSNFRAAFAASFFLSTVNQATGCGV
ncbi:hypothetical protein Cni_G27090 [Canna indica]|uniref:Uncharacterized protein n=1 Tax=Canna indica TaxID=4628 RepID=A0AAQ3L4X2_9LILI|nr:hypothetical protein Cni_G27090 [Canna indica]